MIRLKDLDNRVYSGKVCTRFEYSFIANGKRIIANFDRQPDELSTWNMQIVFGRTRDKDSDVYNFSYTMPKEHLPLELVAATGIRFFQLYLKEEIQEKSNIDFVIGEVVRGM